MSQSSDGIIGGPASREEAAELPDDIIGGPPVARPAGRRAPGVPFGRPRAPPTQGTFFSWLVGWEGIDVTAAAASEPSAERWYAVGGAMCEWEFVKESPEARATHESAASTPSSVTKSAVWGYIQHKVLEAWAIEDGHFLPG